jgi:hypothetical protein
VRSRNLITSDDRSRIDWHLVATLVSGRKAHRRNLSERANTQGLRHGISAMVGVADQGFSRFSLLVHPSDAPLLLRDVGSNDIYALTLEEK